MTEPRGADGSIHSPIDCRIMAFQPRFAYNQDPSCKLSNLEGEVFQMLICDCNLSNLRGELYQLKQNPQVFLSNRVSILCSK